MIRSTATWLTVGTGIITVAHAPVPAAVAGSAVLALITWLALTATHAKDEYRRDAARTTLTLLLRFLRPPPGKRHQRS